MHALQAADLAENIVDLSLEVYSCPEKDILDYLIDPEGCGITSYSKVSMTHHYLWQSIFAHCRCCLTSHSKMYMSWATFSGHQGTR